MMMGQQFSQMPMSGSLQQGGYPVMAIRTMTTEQQVEGDGKGSFKATKRQSDVAFGGLDNQVEEKKNYKHIVKIEFQGGN